MRSAFIDARKDEATVGVCKSLAPRPPFPGAALVLVTFLGVVIDAVGVDCWWWRYGCGEVVLCLAPELATELEDNMAGLVFGMPEC